MKLARKVKDLLQKLRANNLQHSDLTFQNISYRMGASGDIERLGLIDFEFSTHLMDPHVDTDSIQCDASSLGLLPFMKKAGILIPDWLHQAVSSGKDPDEVFPHKGDWLTFRSPFKALRLPVLYLN
jgi:hypothetical protein